MNEQELGARSAAIIKNGFYANIATCRNDQPWNTPVTAMADENLDLYWSSWTEAVHSHNIQSNPRVFVTLYDSTRARGTNNLRCLYLRCEAAVVTSRDEGRRAHALVYPEEAIDLDGFFDQGLRRFYRARPTQAWLNCLSERQVGPNTIDMRTELPVAAIRAAI
ncbi:pyridoxamine 5'-phosphate oxidase family protein [Salinisphaera sp. Q1T1-3]|uniref:pyridoxamine 5'-phosphate oxidase family protein n=1 Tax=Salinisphaera sp. Q1T1-3 TaxID=2321229 RepID=UPI000E7324F0|nr:pyridoxamine 5'-phosphate oxidase family protein [Salinisphaera sp. Q1T1-3]RJS95274.1 pyridoxamine 5'-phosphate oxidase family protein [Salinisphaera sp. Q1T1-3]